MNWSRIRDKRKEKGYTLAQVAAETGYSVGYLSQLERNQKEPSLAALRKIANCLGCSEVWLIMQGQLEVHIGTHVYNALEGDCLYIPKNTLHNYLNTGLEDAQCIVFFSDLIY